MVAFMVMGADTQGHPEACSELLVWARRGRAALKALTTEGARDPSKWDPRPEDWGRRALGGRVLPGASWPLGLRERMGGHQSFGLAWGAVLSRSPCRLALCRQEWPGGDDRLPC